VVLLITDGLERDADDKLDSRWIGFTAHAAV